MDRKCSRIMHEWSASALCRALQKLALALGFELDARFELGRPLYPPLLLNLFPPRSDLFQSFRLSGLSIYRCSGCNALDRERCVVDFGYEGRAGMDLEI